MKECCAKYRIRTFRKLQFLRNIVAHYTVMKVIVPHFTTLFNYCSARYSFAKYSFVVILLCILQFSQNTKNVEFCYAKYSLKCCAKYSLPERLLRKIQELLLRKIQISPEIVAQNTGPDVALRLRKLQMLRKIQ